MIIKRLKYLVFFEDVDISLARKWLDLWMGPDKKGRKTNQADVSRILFKLSLQAEKEIVPEAVELLLNRLVEVFGGEDRVGGSSQNSSMNMHHLKSDEPCSN